MTLLVLQVGCTRADAPRPDPPVVVATQTVPAAELTPPQRVDAPLVDAAPDAPPLDAALAGGPHTFVRVTDFSDRAYFGAGALEATQLPAYDPKTRAIAVLFQDDAGLGTLPNGELRVLDLAADPKTTHAIPIWTFEDSQRFLGKHDPDARIKRAMMTAIDAKIGTAERALAAVSNSFAPMVACTADDAPADSDPDAPGHFPYCGGHTIWHCGDDLTLTYKRDKDGLPDKFLVANGQKISTAGWQLPPIKISGVAPPDNKVPTTNCIVAAHRIPESRRVLVELQHVCNASGDWCYVGGDTWHIVTVR